jgi:hypothetical protein
VAGESSRFDHVAAELLEETGTVTIIPGRPASAAGTNAAPNPIPSALEAGHERGHERCVWETHLVTHSIGSSQLARRALVVERLPDRHVPAPFPPHPTVPLLHVAVSLLYPGVAEAHQEPSCKWLKRK